MSLRHLAVVAAIAAIGLSSRSAAQVPGQPSTGGAIDPQLLQPVRPGMVQPDPRTLRQSPPAFLPAGEAPKAVSVTATGARTVSLAWSPTAGSIGYWVHRADASGTFYRGSTLITNTFTTVTYLLPGTSYSFKVSAVYPQEAQLSEGFSEAVPATTNTAPVPTGLAATDNGTGFHLTWDKLPEADSYRLYRDGALVTEIKPWRLDRNSRDVLPTSYDDRIVGGLYRYQIQAVYRAGGAEVVSALSWPGVDVVRYDP
jgi:Fibronectin type III domain